MDSLFPIPLNAFYMQKSIKHYPIGIVITWVISIGMVSLGHAEQGFDPAFLTDGIQGAQISDLSRFDKSTQQIPGIYRVDIYVNDRYISTRDINFTEKPELGDVTGLFPCFDSKTLQGFDVNITQYPLLSEENQQCINFVSIIEGANSQFQFDKQKLMISLPQASLRNQIRGYISPDQWDEGITGLFTNYSLSGYKNSKTDSNSLFLRLDNGINIGSWQFRNATSYSYNTYGNKSSNQWVNLNSYLQKAIIPLKSKLIIGDGSSNSEIFDSFSFRGLHLSTADAMYPDSQQGYAPSIRGVAKTNAKVVIKQNGYVLHQINVAPGPFLIEDLNPTSINGDLIVTIEESDGSIQSFQVPFSTLPILQREGRTKYSVIIGKYRSGNDNQDKPTLIQVTTTHGLKKGISVYTGTQLSEKYKSVLLGFGANLGDFGALSFDVTHADSVLADESSHSGQSIRFLYSKSLLSSGTTFQLLGYRYSTKGFYTLNDVAYNSMDGYHTNDNEYPQNENIEQIPDISDHYNLYNTKKGRFELNISHSLGKYGSLYISGNQQTYWNTNKKNEWAQAGYANAWKGLNYTLSISHSKSTNIDQNDTRYSMNLSFPLDKLLPKANYAENSIGNSYATLSSFQNTSGQASYQAGLGGTLFKNRNLNYSISASQSNQQSTSSSLSLDYSGGYGSIGANYSYDQQATQFGYRATGGILLHGDGITFGQTLGSTSILIKAPGAKGVNIENYTGVKTDWRGYAIVPYASEYRANRIALDPSSFDNHLEISNNVESVVPIQGAIVRAKFNTSVGIRALITLTHNGKFVPYASRVIETKSLIQSMVADDGRVYLTALPPKGTLEVSWGETTEQKCITHYDIPKSNLSQPVVQLNLECK
ncbi:outer membrane usher protein FimD [Acinetobacter bereziniae]|uniref:PapC N-terminal domain-containing protein n=1 Tax=Acinetobacter bereziniae NIPH 3 TaxID=1217651 RepID=N8YT47_ACIBZ|nr:outer membrane usher protein FimD [Acinetobacter bereziniae]ENV22733.1 hypothetical protein F963_01349 [Acinetobacter bereziniae NIPH 3]